MVLLSILIGLGLEYFLGTLDRIRNFSWFKQYSDWLELRCNKYSFWNGPAGVLITLGIPLLLLYFIANRLEDVSTFLSFILAVFIFIVSLGSDVNRLVSNYIDALKAGDEGSIRGIEHQLGKDNEAGEDYGVEIIHSVMLRAHNHIFAVIFWFIGLGVVGALLYCLVIRMKERFNDIHGGYADAVRNLYSILIWPSARLFAIAIALAGSLVDALEGWREVDGHTIDCSEDVIRMSGSGALQYHVSDTDDENEQRKEYLGYVQEIRALLNRTLIIWLTVLGIMTLRGILI